MPIFYRQVFGGVAEVVEANVEEEEVEEVPEEIEEPDDTANSNKINGGSEPNEETYLGTDKKTEQNVRHFLE